MSDGPDQKNFLDVIKGGFFDPEQIDRVHAETAADHFVGLVLQGGGVVESDQDRENCRASAAEDIAMLLECSDEYARLMVDYLEIEKSWELAINGEA